jgi:hypothetical protein
MRTWQLQLLTEDELAMLVYIVSVASPIKAPTFEIKKKTDLLIIRHDALLWKCSEQEKNLTDEAKPIFTSLMMKLNMTLNDYFKSIEKALDYDNSPKPEFVQSEFQF